jgi:hypothetical protein
MAPSSAWENTYLLEDATELIQAEGNSAAAAIVSDRLAWKIHGGERITRAEKEEKENLTAACLVDCASYLNGLLQATTLVCSTPLQCISGKWHCTQLCE